jgi:hypothetical protein
MKHTKKIRSRELRAIQQSIEDAVGGAFNSSQLEALRVVIRITVEFHADLKSKKVSNYAAASIFSGIESFVSLTHAYSVLEGAELQSRLQWNDASATVLRRKFKTLYRRFMVARILEQRMRMLLDLFKLQIAFAALAYDCAND